MPQPHHLSECRLSERRRASRTANSQESFDGYVVKWMHTNVDEEPTCDVTEKRHTPVTSMDEFHDHLPLKQ